MYSDDALVTIAQAAKWFRKKPRTIARQLQRRKIVAQKETYGFRGKPRKHYRWSEICDAMIDRRYKTNSR